MDQTSSAAGSGTRAKESVGVSKAFCVAPTQREVVRRFFGHCSREEAISLTLALLGDQ